jgi:hypothetical protein
MAREKALEKREKSSKKCLTLGKTYAKMLG